MLYLHLTGLSYIDIHIDADISVHCLTLELNVLLTVSSMFPSRILLIILYNHSKPHTTISKMSDYFSSVSKNPSNQTIVRPDRRERHQCAPKQN